MAIWRSASRTATGEILKTPLKGEYIDILMKIAAEAASAQMTSVRITVALRGASIPKLTKIAVNHDVTTTNTGIDIEDCCD